ncbi:hypothetical protein FQA39_LY17587 [Lamprigera yunnana]|nr:hypothetical protein FQA39_LY17587 [Lamprigera yunnana]
MNQFVEYLSNTKKAIPSVNFSETHVHIIIGNESCDLDSMISALALAYLHYRQYEKKSKGILVLPVLNIFSGDFSVRTENCYVLDQLKVNKEFLLFRDTISLEDISKYNLLKVSLVDHHMLRKQDMFLEKFVIEVFDHRPRDTKMTWNKDRVHIVIEEVASCASLIANEILNENSLILNRTLATLLYDVIIFDSIALNPAVDKVRDLDLKISQKLKEMFDIKITVEQLFEELWQAHNNVSHLTPKQLLVKDLKFIEKLPIAGVPMLVQDYLKLPNVLSNLIQFCDEIDYETIVIMGLWVNGKQVFRDIGIFAKSNKSLQHSLVSALRGSEELQLEECNVETPNIIYFKQNNIHKSRKHILPLIVPILKK